MLISFGKYFEYASYNLTTCLKTLYKNVLFGYPQTFSKCLNAVRMQSVLVRMTKMKMMIGVMMRGAGNVKVSLKQLLTKLNWFSYSKGNQSPGIPFGKMRWLGYFYLMLKGSCKECSHLFCNWIKGYRKSRRLGKDLSLSYNKASYDLTS